MGEYEKALEEIKKAEELGYSWRKSLRDLNTVATVYKALNNHAGLVSLYKDALKLKPDNTDYWMNLASAYANLGQTDKAREIAMKVKEINPDLSSKIDDFLKKLSQ